MGYCVLDLRGNILKLDSRKELSASILIRILSDLGKVVVVCSDKKKTPEFVKRIAIKLGAIIYSPKEDLAVAEKIRYTKKIDYKNSHERDASASAIIAHNTYKPRINDIVAFLEKKKRESYFDEFVPLALKNKNLNYTEIIDVLQHEKEIKTMPQIQQKPVSETKISQEPNLLRRIMKENYSLLRQINKLREEKKQLEKNNRRLIQNKNQKDRNMKADKDLMQTVVFKEKRYQSLEARYKNLEKEHKELQSAIKDIFDYFKGGYLFLEYSDSLLHLDKIILHSKASPIFIKNINIYSQKAIRKLSSYEGIILSPVKAKKQLRQELQCIFVEWNKFYRIIADRVVVNKSDYDMQLSSKSFEEILGEYKEKRELELGKKD